MRIPFQLAAIAALALAAMSARADEQGYGRCEDGFADVTQVQTETRGERKIEEVQVNDRVWSLNRAVGRPGWSRVLQRIDDGRHFRMLVDFSEPGSNAVTKACWRIKRTS